MQQFSRYHEQVFMSKPSPYGYPDMGSGRYAKRLPYKQWYDFNIAQWNHYNNIEHLCYTLPGILLLGLFYPRLSIGLGSVVLIGW